MAIPNPEKQPILHSPWEEPTSHYEFDPTNLAESPTYRDYRRPSQPSVADIGRADSEIRIDMHVEPHVSINEIRHLVSEWRSQGYRGSPAQRLLMRWHETATEPIGETRPYFCQREAVETVMWLLRDSSDSQHRKIKSRLHRLNTDWNDGLNRMAVKMATGAGKTRAMAMLIGCLEKLHPSGCTVVVINPNLTVTNRLSTLKKEAHDSEIVPQRDHTATHAKIFVINFHKFRQNEEAFSSFGSTPTGIEKRVLGARTKVESPKAMFDRLIDEDPDDLPLYVFQDEGHHCRRRGEQITSGELSADEYDEEGQWYSALLLLRQERNLQAVIDFSATPAYLQRPSQLPTALFPWCVSDCPIEDAIEAGICKIPRVPESEFASSEESGVSNLYRKCIDEERQSKNWGKEPPQEVKDLMRALADDWESTRLERYQKVNRVPAVIAVVNSVRNALVLYKWIAGSRDGQSWNPGAIDCFSNVDPTTNEPLPIDLLPTLMVHSHVGDEREGEDSQSRKIVKEQQDLRAPGKAIPAATEVIRGIYQTVGERNQPGQNIRCVISVAMLSEGWDAKTVTHVFGFRRFNSVLLIEQVVGRALRRTSLDQPSKPEYAEIFGVPYPGLRRGSTDTENGSSPAPPPFEVESLDEKAEFRIEWPCVSHLETSIPKGLRFSLDPSRVQQWDPDLPEELLVTLRDPHGHGESHTIASIKKRIQSVVFELASELAELWLKSVRGQSINGDGSLLCRRGMLFVDAKLAVQSWLDHEAVQITRPDVLTEHGLLQVVIEEIARCCINESGKDARLRPVFEDRVKPTLSTDNIKFTTTLEDIHHPLKKSHLSAAACHSKWEMRVAKELDKHDAVRAWVRNFRLDWRIPWWDRRMAFWREYEPDFVAKLRSSDPHHVVIEVKGLEDPASELKKEAAETWCAVLTQSELPILRGTWSYLYVTDPSKFRVMLDELVTNEVGQ